MGKKYRILDFSYNSGFVFYKIWSIFDVIIKYILKL